MCDVLEDSKVKIVEENWNNKYLHEIVGRTLALMPPRYEDVIPGHCLNCSIIGYGGCRSVCCACQRAGSRL